MQENRPVNIVVKNNSTVKIVQTNNIHNTNKLE